MYVPGTATGQLKALLLPLLLPLLLTMLHSNGRAMQKQLCQTGMLCSILSR